MIGALRKLAEIRAMQEKRNRERITKDVLEMAGLWETMKNPEKGATRYLRNLHNYCDRQCKQFPHKTAENYAYWDIQDRIAKFFGKEEQI